MIPETFYDLLDGPVVVMLATVMPDGQPQVTPVWCSRHGGQIWVNSAVGRQKDQNMRARPQVTIAALDPQNPYRYIEIRGRVVELVEGPAAHDHIEALAQQYFGRSFNYNTPDEKRCIYKIEPTRVRTSA
ncbi:MAG: PPOX class F420-dependent oxidoreductase [Anaerolineales bacterium]|nr:PPOX class F420-dependent oxidoreductase [Anaerolineales bacterium]